MIAASSPWLGVLHAAYSEDEKGPATIRPERRERQISHHGMISWLAARSALLALLIRQQELLQYHQPVATLYYYSTGWLLVLLG